MAVSDQILVSLEPRITPPSIDVLDLETPGSDKQIRDPKASGFSQNLGRKSPFIMIGNTRMPASSILGMTVFTNSLIPTIQVSVLDSTGSLTSVGYPKTNPLLTAYVATGHEKLKSFSQTFLITNVQSIPMGGFSVRYEFFGELYVPKLNGNFIKSYSNMSSAQTLKKIAEELGLGFASNEDSTNDSMTWINPNLNYKAFIKHVTDHSYKSEKTYFECFIDRYYVLNFINVEKQFKQFKDDSEIPQSYPSYSTDYLDVSRAEKGGKPDSNEATISLVLSNAEIGTAMSDLKILEYSMIGDNGDILKTEGFRKRVILYRHGEESPVKDWYSEPISEPSPDGLTAYQAPELTDYLENDIVKWIGTDYQNSHANYKFSKLLNTHNKIEAEKNMLKVKLPGFNQNVLRGSRIKVNIYSSRAKKAYDDSVTDDKNPTNSQKSADSTKSKSTDLVIDTNLTDTYYVKDIVYRYNPLNESTSFTTEILLSRRNWVPAQKMENKA
jgi:hypothetical protein